MIAAVAIAHEVRPAETATDRLGDWLAQPGNHLAVERPAGSRYLVVAYTTAEGRRAPWAYGYGSTAVEAIEDCAQRGCESGSW